MRPIFESTAGTLDWYCINYWSRALALDIAAMKRSTRHEIDWLPDARAFLDRVRASGTPARPRHQRPSRRSSRSRMRTSASGAASTPSIPRTTSACPRRTRHSGGRLAAREPFDPARTLFADDNAAVLGAARDHGIRWLYAVRRPVHRAPARAANGFAGVESVLELAQGLAARPQG